VEQAHATATALEVEAAAVRAAVARGAQPQDHPAVSPPVSFSSPPPPSSSSAAFPTAALEAHQSGPYRVRFTVEAAGGARTGSFVVAVHPSWAPIAAARFRALVARRFFHNSRFFRVVPGFVAQFGISGDPAVTAAVEAKAAAAGAGGSAVASLASEPRRVQNGPGTLAFARPVTDAGSGGRAVGAVAAAEAETQVFVSLEGRHGPHLDGLGFAPFGEVEGGAAGVAALAVLVGACGGEPAAAKGPRPGRIRREGNAYVDIHAALATPPGF